MKQDVKFYQEERKTIRKKKLERLGEKKAVRGTRGIGWTRKNKEQSKKNRKISANSRKKNFQIAKKKFRPTGSKRRK